MERTDPVHGQSRQSDPRAVPTQTRCSEKDPFGERWLLQEHQADHPAL